MVRTPTIYLQKVNRFGFIGCRVRHVQPSEISRWIFIDMNIYKAIWHFRRRCFLLGFFGGVASFYSINCSLCRFPSVRQPNLLGRLTNLTFTFGIRGRRHIPGRRIFVCHINNVLPAQSVAQITGWLSRGGQPFSHFWWGSVQTILSVAWANNEKHERHMPANTVAHFDRHPHPS